ncbi:hypothetical protein AWB81_08427 [Caballeronia arationis]|nr:hypothetical protein AWB81_08427 [Caballeronia arationis]
MLTSHHHAQKELDHIKSIISHLEYQRPDHEIATTSAVAQVNYWRTRICAGGAYRHAKSHRGAGRGPSSQIGSHQRCAA